MRRLIDVELVTDSTLINITVKSGDQELTYAVATAIQSVYPDFSKDAFPTADISVADSATKAKLADDSSTLIYTAIGFMFGAALAVALILIKARIDNKLLSAEDIKNRFNIDIMIYIF